MISRLHHIGIGVADLQAQLRFYRDVLGIQMEAALNWEALGLRAALLKVGDVQIELIQPVAPQGEVAESLAQVTAAHDGCVHHLAFEVDDLDATAADLAAAGVPLMSERPQESASGRLLWLKPEASPGPMIELVETGYVVR